jgi:hypothetical protein
MEDATILKIVGIVVVGAIYVYGLSQGLDPTFGSLAIVLTAIGSFVAYNVGHNAGVTTEKLTALGLRRLQP